MPIMIVERTFTHPLTDQELEHLFAKLGPCLDQHEVRWVHSYLARDQTRMFCAFEAADADTVRTAHRAAGITYEAIWSAKRLAPD